VDRETHPGSGDTIQIRLSRDLGLFSVTMIGVGAMIGAGIFVLTGIAAGTAGPALILSFALNGVVTVFTAMVYAELGSAIPEAGGGYLWVKEGLPGASAFQAGWMSWFAHAVAGSLYALGFGAYLKLVLSELGISINISDGDALQKILAVAVIFVFIGINFKGVSETGLAGNIVTLAKILILLIFVVSGLWVIVKNPGFLRKFENFAPQGWPGIISAMGLTFIAFEGYEIIVQAGEEVVNPRKNIPRAVFLSLAIVVPIYVLVAFVSIGAVSPGTNIPTYLWLARHAELGIAEAARQFMPFGTFLLLVGGLFSTMSALNATTFSSTRVSFAMGRDRNLPNIFGRVNGGTRIPAPALLFSGALILFMAVAVPIRDVAAAADIMFLLLFLQVNLAVITLRKKYGDRLQYGYLAPFFPIVPIIGIFTKLFLALFMFNYSPLAWYFALGWIGSGLIIYYSYVRRRVPTTDRAPLVLHERRAFQDSPGRYRILVPIANPRSLRRLLIPAIAAAQKNEGIILLLNVIVVPEQTPLSQGEIFIDERRKLLSQAQEIAADGGVPVESLIKISHRPAQAIIQTALETKADLLVMGWRGKSRAKRTRVGRNIDAINQQVNCETMIIQEVNEPPFENILIPSLGANQIPAMLAHAALLGSGRPPQIKILRVFSPRVERKTRDVLLERIRGKADQFLQKNPQFGAVIEVSEIESANAVNAIARASRGYDAVLIGASREHFLKKWLFGNKPKQIAKKAAPPVILFRPCSAKLNFGLARLVEYVRGGYKKIDIESEKKLEAEGLLAPRGGTPPGLDSAVNRFSLLMTGSVTLASVVFMFFGRGRSLTWIGAAGFLVCLFQFTKLSLKGTGGRAEKPNSKER
jgi:amino acid transporter/nucleotide-binding universal stress UspA family protein